MSAKKFCWGWLFLVVHYCRIQADTVNLQETLRCNGQALPTLIANMSSIFTLLIEYSTASRMACAMTCSQLASDCHAITYDETVQSCNLYTWDLVTPVTQTLAYSSNKYCWRTKVFGLPSSLHPLLSTTTASTSINSETTTTTATTTTTMSSTIAKPPGIATCSGTSSLTTYTQQTSTSCPAISNCTCDKTLNVTPLQGFSNANDCFANCSRNLDCLAFSYAPNFCYIATAMSHLTLFNSTSAFTCYCNKSTTPTSTSNNVTIKGVNYPNLSCYPEQLFSGSSYITKIPIAGRVADCRCEGGLYLQNGAYVNQSASTFADCFAACEKIPSPPCKALAFMETNNTCIIAPTSSNGESSDKGILQCYT